MRKRLVSITLCTGWQLHARRSCEDLPWWRCRSRRWRLGQTGWSSGTRVEWPAAKGKHKRWEGQLHSYISKSSFLDPNGAGGFFLGGGGGYHVSLLSITLLDPAELSERQLSGDGGGQRQLVVGTSSSLKLQTWGCSKQDWNEKKKFMS